MHGVCFSFQKKDRLCKGHMQTCQSHMRFGSPPKCTWLCFFFGGNSRVCCSSQEGLVRADNATHPRILADRLNARGLRPLFLAGGMRRRSSCRVRFTGSDETSGKVLCVFAGCVNAWAFSLIF